jgi:hypothetical protein
VVTQAALSRMERSMAPLRQSGATPTELEEQLNRELEAIVWMRLGAPPLLHSSKGRLDADPFALRACPRPPPSPGPLVLVNCPLVLETALAFLCGRAGLRMEAGCRADPT